MLKTVFLVALLVVLHVAPTGGSTKPDTAEAKLAATCMQSSKAVSSVCRLFGDSSEACKETNKAHEDKGCASLGEAEEDKKEAKAHCGDNNFDSAGKRVCQAARRLCNIKTKDYCTTQLHIDCMKSIDQICPGESGKHDDPNKSPYSRRGSKGIEYDSTLDGKNKPTPDTEAMAAREEAKESSQKAQANLTAGAATPTREAEDVQLDSLSM